MAIESTALRKEEGNGHLKEKPSHRRRLMQGRKVNVRFTRRSPSLYLSSIKEEN